LAMQNLPAPMYAMQVFVRLQLLSGASMTGPLMPQLGLTNTVGTVHGDR
jgi:hypothetical protein